MIYTSLTLIRLSDKPASNEKNVDRLANFMAEISRVLGADASAWLKEAIEQGEVQFSELSREGLISAAAPVLKEWADRAHALPCEGDDDAPIRSEPVKVDFHKMYHHFDR